MRVGETLNTLNTLSRPRLRAWRVSEFYCNNFPLKTLPEPGPEPRQTPWKKKHCLMLKWFECILNLKCKHTFQLKTRHWHNNNNNTNRQQDFSLCQFRPNDMNCKKILHDCRSPEVRGSDQIYSLAVNRAEVFCQDSADWRTLADLKWKCWVWEDEEAAEGGGSPAWGVCVWVCYTVQLGCHILWLFNLHIDMNEEVTWEFIAFLALFPECILSLSHQRVNNFKNASVYRKKSLW